MKILVTGGTGFAGSHLIEELLASGYEDIYSTCFSVPDEKIRFLAAHRYHQVDLTDAIATNKLLAEIKPDWIFHLASFAYVGKSFQNARELFANNINVSLNVLEAVQASCPTAKVLTIGSAEEYGLVPPHLTSIDESVPLTPLNPYAISKVTQDLLAQSFFLTHKLALIRARPFNHIGTRQSSDFAIPAFARQIALVLAGKQQSIRVGSLTAIRDFTSVTDMVRAYIILMQRGTIGDVYNIGSGTGVSMQWILDTMIKLSGRDIPVETDPTKIRPLDAPGLIADNRKIRALGWELTRSVESELENVLNEWKQK